jgi:AraC-like DNA-binding protein
LSIEREHFVHFNAGGIPQVQQAGLARAPGDLVIAERLMPIYAINVIAHGEMNGIVNGKPLHLRPGVAYFFCAGDRTGINGIKAKGEIVCRWVNFHWPEQSGSAASKIGEADLPRELELSLPTQEQVKVIFDRLLDATTTGRPGWMLAASAAVLEMIAAFIAESASPVHAPVGSSAIDRRLRVSLTFIEQNYRRQIKNEEIADAAQLSKDHFKRLFRKNIGMPPLQYLIRRRIQEARRILASDPGVSVQAACEQAGFGSSKHFASLFRKHFGISPKEFQNTAAPWSEATQFS